MTHQTLVSLQEEQLGAFQMLEQVQLQRLDLIRMRIRDSLQVQLLVVHCPRTQRPVLGQLEQEFGQQHRTQKLVQVRLLVVVQLVVSCQSLIHQIEMPMLEEPQQELASQIGKLQPVRALWGQQMVQLLRRQKQERELVQSYPSSQVQELHLLLDQTKTRSLSFLQSMKRHPNSQLIDRKRSLTYQPML
jgi:hypothetical protein